MKPTNTETSPAVFFTEDTFKNITITEEYYIVTLADGRKRKFLRKVSGVPVSLEDYKTLILKKQDIGTFTFTRNDGTKYEGFLKWQFKPSARDRAKPFGFPKEGTTLPVGFTRIPNGDPNTREDVLDFPLYWRFPSTGNKDISKKMHEIPLTFAEACQIVAQTSSGLTKNNWLSRAKGDPFIATLKWNIDTQKIAYAFPKTQTTAAAATAQTLPAEAVIPPHGKLISIPVRGTSYADRATLRDCHDQYHAALASNDPASAPKLEIALEPENPKPPAFKITYNGGHLGYVPAKVAPTLLNRSLNVLKITRFSKIPDTDARHKDSYAIDLLVACGALFSQQ
jgi:hypothetical protein